MSFTNFCRQLKNKTLYTPVQVRVRDATSNEVNYPSAKHMEEIAQMTYESVRLIEVMSVIWKRLNDGSKNWRHVLKSLNLLEYLLKNGHVKVAEVCHDNIFLICMLQTFQYTDGGVDRGAFVRNKADEIFKLLNEPQLLAKEREIASERRNRSVSEASMSTGSGGLKYPVTSTPSLTVSQKIAPKLAGSCSFSKSIQDSTVKAPASAQTCLFDTSSAGNNPFLTNHSTAGHEPDLFSKNLSPIINANTVKQALTNSKPKMFGNF